MILICYILTANSRLIICTMTKKSKQHLWTAVNLVLTAGASLTLGLLSFGGFYAICPSIIFGTGSAFLATLYEGEIYYSNTKDAIKKLLKPNYFNQKQAINSIEYFFF